jgi:hypothetical protein
MFKREVNAMRSTDLTKKEGSTMKNNYIFLFAVIVIFLSGCATVPTRDILIDAEADPKANFSGYRSYAWLGSAAIVNDPHGQWEPADFDADSEITYLINRELRKRGMSESSADPDMLVAFAAGIDMDALGLKEDPDTKMDMLANVPQGGLVVVLVDNDSGFVIWVGLATAEVQQKPHAPTAKARLDYAVTQLLKKMPQ